ncbi:type II toxin-antitoxin system PemK/MazF family toxin [Thiohalorhabdus sp. Cl-TMA]|uniref:Type II toxin-antitoxin system PemK/MazF family toxin n=1 Tax=Thiohalorhabdus methylotrophus TaxID=3242694 RepID=A0ABV4TXH9_9GAMM
MAPQPATPQQGDALWFRFHPQAGHEQRGWRPGVVVSPQAFNHKTGLVLICPVTNQAKGYPFEVSLDTVPNLSGVILADQVRSLDWRARAGDPITRIPEALWEEMVAKIQPLLEPVDY